MNSRSTIPNGRRKFESSSGRAPIERHHRERVDAERVRDGRKLLETESSAVIEIRIRSSDIDQPVGWLGKAVLPCLHIETSGGLPELQPPKIPVIRRTVRPNRRLPGDGGADAVENLGCDSVARPVFKTNRETGPTHSDAVEVSDPRFVECPPERSLEIVSEYPYA